MFAVAGKAVAGKAVAGTINFDEEVGLREETGRGSDGRKTLALWSVDLIVVFAVADSGGVARIEMGRNLADYHSDADWQPVDLVPDQAEEVGHDPSLMNTGDQLLVSSPRQ